MGAAWPRHAARRTLRAAGGAASTSARSESPRPPASEEDEYIYGVGSRKALVAFYCFVYILAPGCCYGRVPAGVHDAALPASYISRGKQATITLCHLVTGFRVCCGGSDLLLSNG